MGSMDCPIVVLLAVVFLSLAVSFLLRHVRRRWISGVTLADEDANSIRAELLRYVQDNTFAEQQEVSLHQFWRGRRLREADRRAVVDPLYASRTLLIMKKKRDSGGWRETFEEFGEMWVQKVLLPLPQRVVLHPKIYYRMLHDGISATTIVMEQVIRRQHVDNRTQSFTAGQDAQVSGVTFGDRSPVDQDAHQVRSGATVGELVSVVERLAEALRADAVRLEQSTVQDTVNNLADDADEAASSESTPELTSVLNRAIEYCKLLGAGLSETQKVLDGFNDVINRFGG